MRIERALLDGGEGMRYGEASNLAFPGVGDVMSPATGHSNSSAKGWSPISSQYPSREPSCAGESAEEMQMLIFMVSKMEDEYPIVELRKDPKYNRRGIPTWIT